MTVIAVSRGRLRYRLVSQSTARLLRQQLCNFCPVLAHCGSRRTFSIRPPRSAASALRHADDSQAFVQPLTLCEIDRIRADGLSAQSRDGEATPSHLGTCCLGSWSVTRLRDDPARPFLSELFRTCSWTSQEHLLKKESKCIVPFPGPWHRKLHARCSLLATVVAAASDVHSKVTPGNIDVQSRASKPH